MSAALLLALSHASLAAQVGLTEGAFKVNELGQATYTIPIKLPAGGELVPSISLNYRSIESEGIAGVGWTLAGTSAIDRCPKVAAISGTSSGVTLTRNDYLCLDGQRLRTISGTYGATNSTYGTHLDSGAVVTALGSVGTGPAAFSVKQLDGSTWYYGDLSATGLSLKNSTGSATATADATIAAGSVTGTWLLKAIVDGSGNYIVYEYGSGGIGEKVLTSIHYTGHPGASHPKSKATFTYSARSHATSARYRFGTIAQETRLLSGISVFQV